MCAKDQALGAGERCKKPGGPASQVNTGADGAATQNRCAETIAEKAAAARDP